MIEVSYSWNGRKCNGKEIAGLDIGAWCLRSLYLECENRRVIKVKGQTRNRHFHDSYTHPKFFLIQDEVVVANIDYDRSDLQKAKDIVNKFIINGEIPLKYKL